MADRRRDVVLLLGSRSDGLYLPAGVSSRAGFVPAVLEPCASCGGVLLLDDFGNTLRRRRGRGIVLDRFGRRQPCSGCGGHLDEAGAIVPGAGVVARDPMDAAGARVGSSSSASTARPRRTVPCDRCAGDGVWRGERCALCGGDGRRDEHLFELHLDTRDVDERDPLLLAIERRDRAGSYRELDRALQALRACWPVWWRAVISWDTAGEAGADIEHGLAFVVARMPDPIRVPPDVRANGATVAEHRRRVRGRAADPRALEQRDGEVRRLLRAGRPAQWVAREFGLSVSQVNRLAKGGRAA